MYFILNASTPPAHPCEGRGLLANAEPLIYVHIMFLIYIISNISGSSLYTGHTDNLGQRMQEHIHKSFGGFSAKYKCHRLMWFETHPTREAAFTRERQIKRWKREWKLNLIKEPNPSLDDLYPTLTEAAVFTPQRHGLAPRSLPSQG